MGTTTISTMLENLSMQLQEIEMLQAMFPGEKEIVWDDPSLLIDLEEYINSCGKTPHQLRFVSFYMNLDISVNEVESSNKICLRMSITLPTSYPSTHPDISITSNELTRKNQSQLNQDLMECISKLDHGEIILLNLISWLKENVTAYYSELDNLETVKCESVDIDEELYMWLYMHHIYNKEKRKNIIHWADELSLTGFSLPGKPGVVYIEGSGRNVEEYFERLKRLNWKRMSCKVKEKCRKRIFKCFEELCFDVHGGRDYHMDMGKFFLFLKDNGIGYMFKELFGVEGHG